MSQSFLSRSLEARGSFDPVELGVLYQAFDDVWLELAPHIDPVIHELARRTIASALMEAAIGGERDPEKLWCHGMHRGRALSTLYWMTKAKPTTVRDKV